MPLLTKTSLISTEGNAPTIVTPNRKNPNGVVIRQSNSSVYLDADELNRLFDALDLEA
jgi:hypothetical protein